MNLTAEDLRKMIDVAWDAVNNSKAGPIKYDGITCLDGTHTANMIAVHTLQSVLQCILPKGTIVHQLEKQKEDWEGE